MSEQKNTRAKVPSGQARYVKTQQKAPNEKGYIGYETVWESFQKEAEYARPKQP